MRYGSAPIDRLNPEELVSRAAAAALRATSRADPAAREAIAWVSRAEAATTATRCKPERAVAIGTQCKQIRDHVAMLPEVAGGPSRAPAPTPSRPASPMLPRTPAPPSIEAVRARVRVERLPEIRHLSPDEYEERVEDVSTEILNTGSQLRGGALRVEACRLLGQAGYRKKV